MNKSRVRWLVETGLGMEWNYCKPHISQIGKDEIEASYLHFSTMERRVWLYKKWQKVIEAGYLQEKLSLDEMFELLDYNGAVAFKRASKINLPRRNPSWVIYHSKYPTKALLRYFLF